MLCSNKNFGLQKNWDQQILGKQAGSFIGCEEIRLGQAFGLTFLVNMKKVFCKRKFWIRGQEEEELIPFSGWIMPFPVFK